MSSLPIRLASAIVAICALFLAYKYFSLAGLLFAGIIIILAAMHEYYSLTLKPLFKSAPFQLLFYTLNFTVLAASVLQERLAPVLNNLFISSIMTTLAMITLLCTLLWLLRGKIENQQILTASTFAALGILYCGLLPSFALKLLYLPNGLAWFLLMLTVVFAGDTFAFFAGNLFGKKKLMASVSPGKTVAGFWGGTLGSVLIGFLVGKYFLPAVSAHHIIFVTFIGSLFSQTGDLFESLIKRVANVKDSGHFMPGHGGALDRIDSVYFAAPIFYAAAMLLNF